MALPVGLDAVFNLATGQGFGTWINMGINLIASTIIGGIVLIIILATVGKAWHENVPMARSFFVVFVINLITQFGIVGLITGFLPGIAMASIIVNLLLWIGLIKVFFGQMKMSHAAVVGVIGYVVSLIIVPMILGIVLGLVPAF